MDRANNLFNDKDYRYAAFCAHESIELGLKGYLMHYGLLKNPKKAGHLQYAYILKQLENEIKRNNRMVPNIKQFCNEILKHIKNVSFAFTELKDDDGVCMAFWKKSLNVELTIPEQQIFSEINERLQSSIKKELVLFDKYFLTKTVKNNIGNMKVHQEVQNISETLVKCRDTLAENTISNIDDLGQDMYKDLESMPNRPELANIKKLFTIIKTMNWMDVVAYAFSHQQISRYPDKINEKTIEELYKEHKNELRLLMNKINNCCHEMESSCASLYGN